MDAPAPVHLKEMYKGIRHVLYTKGYGLNFGLRQDIIKWALKALSDSDFASDKETRISVFCAQVNRNACVNVPVSAPASRSRITTKLPIKLYISNTTTILHGQEQSWETIQIRCDQLTGPHGSCQILRCWYTCETPCSPVSQKSEEYVRLITENHVLTSSEI